MIKLFVVGYPPEMEEIELIELFVLYGMIHSINMVKDKTTHKSLGYAFIEMVDQAGADRAIDAIDGTMVKGRKITVKVAVQKIAGKNNSSVKPHHANKATASVKAETMNHTTYKTQNKRPRKSVLQDKSSDL
nr:hypothetical protein [Pedobacter panaciterrae]